MALLPSKYYSHKVSAQSEQKNENHDFFTSINVLFDFDDFALPPPKIFYFMDPIFLMALRRLREQNCSTKKKIFFRKSHKTAKIELGQPSQTRF